MLNTHARRNPRLKEAGIRRANVQIVMGEAAAHIVRKANHTNRFFSFRAEDSPLFAAGSFNKFIFMILISANFSPISVLETPNPIISDLNVSSTSGVAGSIYTLSVRIKDPAGAIPILHQIREGKETIAVPLRDDGLEGDAVKGDGIFTGSGEVPPTAAKQTHHFEVFVRDHTGRKSNVLEYRFTVVEGVGI